MNAHNLITDYVRERQDVHLPSAVTEIYGVPCTDKHSHVMRQMALALRALGWASSRVRGQIVWARVPAPVAFEVVGGTCEAGLWSCLEIRNRSTGVITRLTLPK
jgi:hypothetical protein